MFRRIRPRYLVLVVVAGLSLAACGQGDAGGGNSSGGSAKAPASSQAPSLPSRLPTITDAASVEKVQRDLINLAAQTAVGAPDADRHPEVVATSDFACGVKIKAIACPDTADPVHGKVVLYINPGVTWEQYQEPIGHGGGDIVVQNSTLAAYVQYLSYREIQREHPADLSATLNDDAAITRSIQIMMCKNGEVYGGLHYVMTGELAQMWQANTARKQGAFFSKGIQGEC